MRVSKPWIQIAVVASLSAPSLSAQDLAKRVTASDGIVNVVYPSRPVACGDGRTFIQNVLGEDHVNRSDTWTGRTNSRTSPCVHGPARVAVTVLDGAMTRMRLYVGPVPPATADTRTLTVSAAEAVEWLGGLASRGSSRIAPEAIMPLIVADAADPWPLLLHVARDDTRPRDVRHSAVQWLANAVTNALGLYATDSPATDDDEMREQAVFVLSQRPKGESVPELIDLARTARNAAARRSAIFWLGQTGDMRAAGVFADLLHIR
jgi:hypothetical protein